MAEVLIRVELDSPAPAYRQIVDQMRVHLNSGRLKPGDVLPSVRVLAMQLGVHFNTIAEAYRQLAEEGWIELRHGRRAVVRERESRPGLAADDAKLLLQRLRHLLAEMRLKGISSNAIQREMKDVFGR
ncbi:MAG TPA: GntR family transcriptional regulator [Acidobacteriaceae bacterium]|nr:GntR family transcriptional regulator [Acidobacteriaceae bacterium]